MRAAVVIVSLGLLTATPCAAQQSIATSFGELTGRIRPGETLFITDMRGTTIKGKLLTLAGPTMDVRLGRNEATPPLRLTETDVNNIYVVRRDRWWDGPLIGFAIGVGTAGLVEAANSRGEQKFQGGSLVGLGNLSALIGLAFDLLNKDTVTVYVQPSRSKI